MDASWKGLKVFSLFDRDTVIAFTLCSMGIINKFNVLCWSETVQSKPENPTKEVEYAMSNLELYTSQTNVFGGFQKHFEKAEYMILGVPFDATSTYRSGARFGPNAILQASLSTETYSFRAKRKIPRETLDLVFGVDYIILI